ncbi:MAG: radical SAM protein [Oscillospiraceae bacterium]|nr:radical SAM protein [Oscillospiraceae bacterium]
MRIDRIIYPITSLGPGDRLVIWTVGCSKHCYKCANPELWEHNVENEIAVEELVNAIKTSLDNQIIDGVTITGGDPLEQYEELSRLLPLLFEITDDILVFTGYTKKQAEAIMPSDTWEVIKKYTAVLIDGKYIDELNDNKCPLRGSSNQQVHFFDLSKKARYLEYMARGRSVQNVYYNEKIISVGIHNKESNVK